LAATTPLNTSLEAGSVGPAHRKIALVERALETGKGPAADKLGMEEVAAVLASDDTMPSTIADLEKIATESRVMMEKVDVAKKKLIAELEPQWEAEISHLRDSQRENGEQEAAQLDDMVSVLAKLERIKSKGQLVGQSGWGWRSNSPGVELPDQYATYLQFEAGVRIIVTDTSVFGHDLRGWWEGYIEKDPLESVGVFPSTHIAVRSLFGSGDHRRLGEVHEAAWV
jgi:hypothetical protein